MDSDRWGRAQEVFHQALDVPNDNRDVFVRERCQGDTEVSKLVGRLIQSELQLPATWDSEVEKIANGPAVSERPPEPALPVEDMGPYQFVRWLGRGGMGIVCQAKHRGTEQVVAIKILRATEFSIADRERFATEQRALAKLDHPLIARLYGSERLRDGTPCFVMEYVEGETLTAYSRNRNSTIRQRILLFRQVCQAVQHAHEHAVIHRDLKPSNILVKDDGSVRLLDFGIAKVLDAPSDRFNVSSFQPAPMTLTYAAPEQVNGGLVGTQTDVYILGVTLYELLTGRVPLDLSAMSLGEAEHTVNFVIPEKPSRFVAQTSENAALFSSHLRADWKDLDRLCMTAIHKDPDRRYRTVEALIRDLDHWLSNEPLDQSGDNLRYRALKFAQRNARILLTASALFLVAVTASVWFTVGLARARNQAVQEQVRAERVEKFVLSLFDQGDLTAGPKRNMSAVDMLKSGRKEVDTLTSDKNLQANLRLVLGTLYRNLGDFRASESLLNAALAEQLGNSNESAEARSEILINLGLLEKDQSKFADAERLVRSGLAVLAQHPRTSQAAVARGKSALGNVFVAEQNYRSAIPELREALRIQKYLGAEADQALTLTILAGALQESGDYPEAVSLNQRALTIDRRLYGETHPRVGADWQSLGNIRQMQKQLELAINDYEQARRIYTSWYGENHPEIAEILICLGQAQMSEGHLEAARKTLTEGVKVGARLLGPKTDVMMMGLNVLGTLEQKADHFDLARTYFERLISAANETQGSGSYIAMIGLNNLGTLDRETGHYRAAEHSYRAALGNLAALHMTNHVDAAKLQVNLANTLLKEHHFNEAEALAKEALVILQAQPEPPKKDIADASEALRQAFRQRQR